MNNIILTGMPGCGKSTVGVVLAKILGYGFTDCDLVIQEQTGKRLFELIEENGNDGFLEIENRINSQINVSNCVIATGGSAVFGENAMKHFKDSGTVVYIRLSLGEIENRLGDLAKRGVVMKNGDTLADCYYERKPFYEKYADVTVDCDGLTLSETVNIIISEITPYER